MDPLTAMISSVKAEHIFIKTDESSMEVEIRTSRFFSKKASFKITFPFAILQMTKMNSPATGLHHIMQFISFRQNNVISSFKADHLGAENPQPAEHQT